MNIHKVLDQIHSDIVEYGIVFTDSYNHHHKTIERSAEDIRQLISDYKLCTECVCSEELSQLMMDRDIDLIYTQYNDYRLSILIEQDEEQMKEIVSDV